jgi:hypothetical protein
MLQRGLELTQLTQLTRLHMDCYDSELQPDWYWAMLGQLPRLLEAQFDVLCVDVAAAEGGVQLAQLTRLQAQHQRARAAGGRGR